MPTSIPVSYLHLVFKFLLEVSLQIFDLHTLLLHRITITDSYSTICLRLKIVSHTERSTDLILSSVTLTDVSSVIEFAVEVLAQFSVYLFCSFV